MVFTVILLFSLTLFGTFEETIATTSPRILYLTSQGVKEKRHWYDKEILTKRSIRALDYNYAGQKLFTSVYSGKKIYRLV